MIVVETAGSAGMIAAMVGGTATGIGIATIAGIGAADGAIEMTDSATGTIGAGATNGSDDTVIATAISIVTRQPGWGGAASAASAHLKSRSRAVFAAFQRGWEQLFVAGYLR